MPPEKTLQTLHQHGSRAGTSVHTCSREIKFTQKFQVQNLQCLIILNPNFSSHIQCFNCKYVPLASSSKRQGRNNNKKDMFFQPYNFPSSIKNTSITLIYFSYQWHLVRLYYLCCSWTQLPLSHDTKIRLKIFLFLSSSTLTHCYTHTHAHTSSAATLASLESHRKHVNPIQQLSCARLLATPKPLYLPLFFFLASVSLRRRKKKKKNTDTPPHNHRHNFHDRAKKQMAGLRYSMCTMKKCKLLKGVSHQTG